MNSTNNGYLGFDNVRIPRMQMLMKNAQVLKVNNCFQIIFSNKLRRKINIEMFNSQFDIIYQ